MRRIRIIFMIAYFCLGVFTLCNTPLFAEEEKYVNPELCDTPGILVKISLKWPEYKFIGSERVKTVTNVESAREQLKERVEKKLREAEIRVLTEKELQYVPGKPIMKADFDIYDIRSKTFKDDYIYTMTLEYLEEASLKRDPNVTVYAAGWSVRIFGRGIFLYDDIEESLFETIIKTLEGKIDSFIQEIKECLKKRDKQ